MNRVFLVEPNNRYDLRAAESFGRLVYVVDKLNPYNTTDSAQQLLDGLKANNFNPQEDFLCLTGHTLPVAFLLSMASELYGSVRLLMFESRTSTYRERVWSPRQTVEAA